MNCNDFLDHLYEYAGDDAIPLLFHLRMRIHTFFCPQCAREIERFEVSRDMLRNDFFPPAPDFEDRIMARLFDEEVEMDEAGQESAGVSFRGWVITGLVMLVTLATSFFGRDFTRVASSHGTSFLLPVGITIGAVLSIYGAFFIGSHLKELSERFGLR
jgi:hypothetical protein